MITALVNGRLIDGTGANPVEDGVVLISGNRITNAARADHLRIPERAIIIDVKGQTIMPGLVDAHVHLVNTGDPDQLRRLNTSPPKSTIRAVVHAKQTLMAGITSVRDLAAFGGGIDFALRDSVEEGLIPGPRMKVSGRSLTITGGHSDPHNGFPENAPLAWTYGFSVTVDSPEEAVKATRVEIRNGADCIKFCATGGILSEGTDNRAVGMPEEDMAAAITEAHNRGKRTAAHAQGTEGIKNAIRAGIDSIEHGTWFDDEAIELLIRHGVYLVPTLSAGFHIRKMGIESGISEQAVRKALADPEAGARSLRRVYQAGGKIAMGTDAGTAFNFHGSNAGELELMVKAGMSAMDVLVAATQNGAVLLDIDAGVLSPGKLADVIVVAGNPVDDISLLSNPDHIPLMMKDGNIYKNQLD